MPDRENYRLAWTPEQMADLLRLVRDDLTAQQIAGRLGRTEESVQLKARQLGIQIARSARHRREG